jgi:hypothetical protein
MRWSDVSISPGHARVLVSHEVGESIDKATVITGSFNFTKQAEEKNAENLLVLRSRELAKAYIDNWERHKVHSSIYMGR